MAKTKALTKEEKEALKGLALAVLDAHFPGKGGQTRFAGATGISQSTVSDLANKGEGGGVASLRALARYRPVEIVKLLGIELATLVGLWGETDAHGVQVAGLPEPVRKAARAAVELWGCTPDDAHKAALAALNEPEDPDVPRSPHEWLMAIRVYLPRRHSSGLRRKV